MFMMPVATLLFFLIAQTCCTASDPSLLRNVTSGLVQGTWQYIHNPGTGGYEGRVAVWKSIPYGQAPAANLRWRPPLPALRWSGILDATKYRAPCVQSDGSGSEDCLHLHITAPADAPDCSVSLLPVLVYIHGGGLMDGCGSFEDMGAFTLHANVVVVTINYRLNVFGWLALKSLQSADGSVGNYGMLDQQLALQWTRSNIMAFGGDPNRVTVAGQSSGGTSIFALYCSPLSVGLFDRAVSFSGSINISMDPGRAFLQNKVIPDLLNCSGVAELECLHRASVQQLVQAQQLSKWGQTPGIFGLDHTSPGGLSPSARWFGLPVVDGVSIVLGFSLALRAAVVDKPLIISSMGQECDIAPDSDVHALPLTQWLQSLNQTFNQQPWHHGSAVAAAYASDSEVDPALAYASINADYSLTCGNVAVASAAKRGKFTSPIYVVSNQWHPEHTAAQPRPRWAFHTFDYHAAFEQWQQMGMIPSSQDLKLSALMRDVLAAYIYGNLSSGNPWNLQTVDSSPQFPSVHVSNVVAIETDGNVPVADYKAEVCALWAEMAVDERFWWIN